MEITMEIVKEKYLGAVHKKFPDAKIEEKSEKEVIIIFKDGMSLKSYLQNLFDEVKNDPTNIDNIIDHRMKVIDDVVQKTSHKEMTIDVKTFRKNVILCVKEKGFAIGSERGKIENELLRKSFTKHHIMVMAIDHERMICFVSRHMIDQIKLTEKEAWDIATKNTDDKKWQNTTKAISGGSKFVFSVDSMQHMLCSPKQMRKIINGKKMIGVIPFKDYIIMHEHKDDIKKDTQTYLDLWARTTTMIDDGARNHPISGKPFIINKDGTIEDFKFMLADPKNKGKSIEVDEGQIMAVQVDKKTGKSEVKGMMNIGGEMNGTKRPDTTKPGSQKDN